MIRIRKVHFWPLKFFPLKNLLNSLEMFPILLLTYATLLTPQFGQATALARLSERRLPFVCSPMIGRTNFSFRDCINAIHLMAHQAQNPQDLTSFGSSSDADIQISNGDPLIWEYGKLWVNNVSKSSRKADTLMSNMRDPSSNLRKRFPNV